MRPGERETAGETPAAREARRVAAAERGFFAGYYAEQRYNPTGWRLRLERDIAALRAATPGGRLGRVLSVGCGDGAFELMLAAHAESVLGVDLSPEAIEAAQGAQRRAGIANAEFRCASFVDMALQERFDAIVCLAFLHHVPEPALADFLATAHAHLEPGGLFYSQDPNVHGVLRAVGRRVLGPRYDTYHSPDERELDPAALAAALRDAGFATVAIRPIDLTLIPALFVLVDGPAFVFHILALVDRLWCASPFARWASGFSALARKSTGPPAP